MKQLTFETLVRVSTWNKMTYASVFTLDGYAKKNNLSEDHVAESIARGDEIVGTIYTGTTITNSETYYENEKQRGENAVVIENGETVSIDDVQYKVVVLPGQTNYPKYSDPIKFVKI